jgi:hypothetical protein
VARVSTIRDSSPSIASGHHAGGGGFDQAVIAERTAFARSAVERLEGNAERGREGAQIGFFAQRTCRDQDAVGADAQRRGSARGVIDHFAGEPGADAVDLRAAVGLAGGAGGDFGGRGIDRGLPAAAAINTLERPPAALAATALSIAPSRQPNFSAG